jgi:hypothetical protein
MAYQSIADRLLHAQTALSNASSDPDLSVPLAEFGYDAERIQEGTALMERARDAHETQVREYGEQYEATEAVQTAFEAAYDQYRKHVKVARVALRGRSTVGKKLKLDEEHLRTRPELLDRMHVFYTNTLGSPDVLAALARFNVTEDKLRAAQADVQSVIHLHAAKEEEVGEAQDATIQRDESVAALDDWMRDFEDIAEVALSDRPQFLEKLGILARS